jgi:hypothetical protein
MAELLAICHDIVRRGQGIKTQHPQQQQPKDQAASVAVKAAGDDTTAITAPAAAAASKQQQQQQADGVGVGADLAAGAAAAVAAANTPPAAGADLAQGLGVVSAGASPVDWTLILDSSEEADLAGSSSKAAKQKQVVLNAQQQKQQERTQRQLALLGIGADSSSSRSRSSRRRRGNVKCKPIPVGAAAGVVCFLPRNTDLLQLSELARQCHEAEGGTEPQQQQQQQQQQWQVKGLQVVYNNRERTGEDGTGGSSSDAAAEDDCNALLAPPGPAGLGQGGVVQVAESADAAEQQQQQQQGDEVQAQGGSYLDTLRSLSVDTLSSVGSLCCLGSSGHSASAVAGFRSQGTTEPILEEGEDCGPAEAAALDPDAALQGAAAAGSADDVTAAFTRTTCAGAGEASAGAAGRRQWVVERNILNHHFKGVTIISGWDLLQH